MLPGGRSCIIASRATTYLRGSKDGTILLPVWYFPLFNLTLRGTTYTTCLLLVILAVSTLAPNPLQAVTELHSRYNDVRLPPWVDPVRLCHTLIIHPTSSPLNSEEYVSHSSISIFFLKGILNLNQLKSYGIIQCHQKAIRTTHSFVDRYPGIPFRAYYITFSIT